MLCRIAALPVVSLQIWWFQFLFSYGKLSERSGRIIRNGGRHETIFSRSYSSADLIFPVGLCKSGMPHRAGDAGTGGGTRRAHGTGADAGGNRGAGASGGGKGP